MPEALVGLDQKGMIRFVNRQTEALFGFDRDELIGKHIDALAPEPLWQIYAEHRDDYFADPRAHSSGLDLEMSGRHHDGTELPINITVSNIDTGDVLLVITALRDGARRRQVVQNVELTRAVVQCSDDAIVSTTPGGIITGWNPAAEKMYGYSGREVIGRSGLPFFPKSGRASGTPSWPRSRMGRSSRRPGFRAFTQGRDAGPHLDHRLTDPRPGRRSRRRGFRSPRHPRTEAGVRGRPADGGHRRQLG